MVLFCFGGHRKSESVKLADFFEHLLDGVFLALMAQSLYKITAEISHDRGGTFGVDRWQVWWKSRRLLYFLVLYAIFLAVSTILVLIGVSAFFSASVLGDEHSVYTNYKVHAMNDLLLLTGIAILLRPMPVGFFQRIEDNDIDADANPDIDYHLLSAGSNQRESQAREGDNHEDEGEIFFEMTASPVANNSCYSNSTPTTALQT